MKYIKEVFLQMRDRLFINVLYKGGTVMKPRIFISSTFYDLKSIREDLYQFIRGFNYEPIEAENGDIGYVPGQDLDKSCYKAMMECDMAVLIVGGRYGSPASDETYDGGDYISVTHKEFRTAVNAGIPVYAFIDQSVNTEYELYKRNKDRFNNPDYEFEFSSADSINVFKFIMELKSISGIPIVSFNKTQEIKEYLSIQWADMFKKYLETLKENKTEEKTKNAVDEMSILVHKMNVMLDSVGKKILSTDNPDEYENVVTQQNIIATSKKIAQGISLMGISWLDSEEKRKENISKLLEVLSESIDADIWDNLLASDSHSTGKFFSFFSQKGISLGAVGLSMPREVRNMKELLSSAKTRDLVEAELVKDEYYEEMIWEDIELDEEEEEDSNV